MRLNNTLSSWPRALSDLTYLLDLDARRNDARFSFLRISGSQTMSIENSKSSPDYIERDSNHHDYF